MFSLSSVLESYKKVWLHFMYDWGFRYNIQSFYNGYTKFYAGNQIKAELVGRVIKKFSSFTICNKGVRVQLV